LQEEETIKELETTAAALMGHEAGLFVVSGTMSNQLAIRTHLQPLQSLLCDARAHVYRYECGGAAYHAGAQTIPVEVPVEERHLNRRLVEKYLVGHDIHYATTKLICLENTLNGSIMPIENIR
jgi:threonine aldolase